MVIALMRHEANASCFAAQSPRTQQRWRVIAQNVYGTETEGNAGLCRTLALMNLPSYCSRIPLSLWQRLGARPSLILPSYATAAGNDAPAMAPALADGWAASQHALLA